MIGLYDSHIFSESDIEHEAFLDIPITTLTRSLQGYTTVLGRTRIKIRNILSPYPTGPHFFIIEADYWSWEGNGVATVNIHWDSGPLVGPIGSEARDRSRHPRGNRLVEILKYCGSRIGESSRIVTYLTRLPRGLSALRVIPISPNTNWFNLYFREPDDIHRLLLIKFRAEE